MDLSKVILALGKLNLSLNGLLALSLVSFIVAVLAFANAKALDSIAFFSAILPLGLVVLVSFVLYVFAEYKKLAPPKPATIEPEETAERLLSNDRISLITSVPKDGLEADASADSAKNFDAFNMRFYAQLISMIRDANERILIAGHGFDYLGERGSRLYANQYLRTIANKAESRKVLRIDFTDSNRESWTGWITLMARELPFRQDRGDCGVTVLKPIYPDAYFFKNFAVVDWEDRRNCKCIIMFPKKISETEIRADFAIYSRDFELCNRLAKTVLSATGWETPFRRATEFNSSLYQCIESTEDMLDAFLKPEHAAAEKRRIEELSKETLYYFSYGSNVNFKRISARAPNAKFAYVARLNGYRLVFREPNIPFRQAFASIEKSDLPDDYVLGLVYKVSKLEQEKLEFFEGVSDEHDEAYEPLRVSVADIAGSPGDKVEVITYVLSEDREEGIPTDAYVKLIYKGFQKCAQHSPYGNAEKDNVVEKEVRSYLAKYFSKYFGEMPV